MFSVIQIRTCFVYGIIICKLIGGRESFEIEKMMNFMQLGDGQIAK